MATVADDGTVTAVAVGSATITVKVNGSCEASCEVTVKEKIEGVNPTPVDQAQAVELRVAPNPTRDVLRIRGLQESVEVRLYSLSGALLKTTTVQPNGRIDVRSLQPGVYLLKVQGQTVRFTKL